MSARARDDRGNVIPIVALGLIMLLTMVAFAVDLGNARQNKAQTSSATDAGALAGAGVFARFQAGSDDGTVATAVSKAASFVFTSLSLSTPAKTSCGTGKYCYTSTDSTHTTVEITSPYCPGGAAADGTGTCPTNVKTQPDGTAFIAAELLHVRTCRDVATQIAGVIGISTLHVCSDSTARGIAPTGVNNDQQDEQNDPYARCAPANEAALFDTAHWFPGNRDVHDGTTFGGTYLYSSDLNLASVVFTIDGVDYTDQLGVAPSPRPTDSAAVQIASKAPPAGMFKYEIKYNKLGSKAELGNGIHTVALYAASQSGKCYQSIWTFTINNAPKANNSTCQEDLFRGGTNPPNGTKVQYGNVVTATYYDETPMFTYTGTDAGTLSHNLIFNVDPTSNPSGGPEYGANVTITDVSGNAALWNLNPPAGQAYRRDFTGPGGGEYKFATKIWYTLPDLGNGNHTFYVSAYDSDQNKAGGDCGVAQWTVNFTGSQLGQVGAVELID